jgi:hypothetical protein
MEHGRSGVRYRLLAPVHGNRRTTVLLINILIWMFPLMATGAAVFAIYTGLQETFSRDGVIHRLQREPDARELLERHIWGTAMLLPSTTGEESLCVYEHQHYRSGKNGGWRTDQTVWVGREAMLSLSGRTLGVDLQSLEFDPAETQVASPEMEAVIVSQMGRNFESGRYLYQCAQPGVPLFADGCVRADGSELTRCLTSRLVLSVGDGTPTRRIRVHANAATAKLACTLLLLLGGLWVLWRLICVGPVLDPLRSWNPKPATPSRTMVYVVATMVAFAVAVVLGVVSRSIHSTLNPFWATYGIAVPVLLATAVAYLTAYDRREKVACAMVPSQATETQRLARVGEGAAELAVRVKQDAPTLVLPEHEHPYAWVRLTVHRVITVGKSQQLECIFTGQWPKQLTVEDPSGSGIVEMLATTLDTRAVFETVSGSDARERLRQYSTIGDFRALADASNNEPVEIEMSYLVPGETLYLLGNIRRVKDSNVTAMYRDVATVPIVEPTDGVDLVVYAGKESSLLQTLERERQFLTWALALIATTAAAYVCAVMYLSVVV